MSFDVEARNKIHCLVCSCSIYLLNVIRKSDLWQGILLLLLFMSKPYLSSHPLFLPSFLPSFLPPSWLSLSCKCFSTRQASISLTHPLARLHSSGSSSQPRLASLLFFLSSSPRTIEADVLDSFGELFSVAAVARPCTAAGPLVLSLWSTIAAQLNDSQQGLPAYLQLHAPKRQPISSSS